ncbi:MAG: hypothetical protein NTW19_07555 [Planctomycetota bacterium]|nr:hypothetical protein [Planctomycetota bacterium]
MAFAAALVLGWAAGNEMGEILRRAIIALVCCWLIGLGVGSVAQRAVQDRIDEYKRQHPIEMEEDKEADPAALPDAEVEPVAEALNTSPNRGN